MNNIEIPKLTRMKSLGVHLDSEFLWKDHIKKRENSVVEKWKNYTSC